MAVKAIFPGSFDPPTFGHLNLIERSHPFFAELHVVIAVNKNKQTLFSPNERRSMLAELVAPWKNVTVALHDRLIVEYAREHCIRVLLRGIRNIEDFAHEFDISLMNRALDLRVETFFIPTDQRFFVLKSSAIKEIASFGGDVSAMVPPLIADALKNKFAPR
jgi:pantetheine-phosphate adenylyltransferase